MDGDFFKETLF